MVVAEEDAGEHPRGHVPAHVVLGALRRLLVEDELGEADQSLTKIATAQAFPCRLPIFADLQGIEQQAHVLDQPS